MADPKELLEKADELEKAARDKEREADSKRGLFHRFIDAKAPFDDPYRDEAEELQEKADELTEQARDARREARDEGARLMAEAADIRRDAARPELKGTDEAVQLNEIADQVERRARGV